MSAMRKTNTIFKNKCHPTCMELGLITFLNFVKYKCTKWIFYFYAFQTFFFFHLKQKSTIDQLI